MSYDLIRLNIFQKWKHIIKPCKIEEFFEEKEDIITEFHSIVKRYNGSMIANAVRSAMRDYVVKIRTPFIIPDSDKLRGAFLQLRKTIFQCVKDHCKNENDTIRVILGTIVLILRKRGAKVT